MNSPDQPLTRKQIVDDQHAKGTLGQSALRFVERKVVPLEKIKLDPHNVRKTLQGMDDLIASIQKHGQIEPGTAIAVEDGYFLLRAGERRYHALSTIGAKTMELMVHPGESTKAHRVKGMVSNLQRADYPPLDLAAGLKALMDEEQLSQDQVAEELSKNKVWVSQTLRILDLPDEAKALVKAATHPVSADSLSRIARLDDKQGQLELIQALVSGEISRNEVRARIEAKKTGAQPAKKGKWARSFDDLKGAVIVQSTSTKTLPLDRVVELLQQALKLAKQEHHPKQ